MKGISKDEKVLFKTRGSLLFILISLFWLFFAILMIWGFFSLLEEEIEFFFLLLLPLFSCFFLWQALFWGKSFFAKLVITDKKVYGSVNSKILSLPGKPFEISFNKLKNVTLSSKTGPINFIDTSDKEYSIVGLGKQGIAFDFFVFLFKKRNEVGMTPKKLHQEIISYAESTLPTVSRELSEKQTSAIFGGAGFFIGFCAIVPIFSKLLPVSTFLSILTLFVGPIAGGGLAAFILHAIKKSKTTKKPLLFIFPLLLAFIIFFVVLNSCSGSLREDYDIKDSRRKAWNEMSDAEKKTAEFSWHLKNELDSRK